MSHLSTPFEAIFNRNFLYKHCLVWTFLGNVFQIKYVVKNHNLAKSITDAGWYQFRVWLEYFGGKFGKITVAVPPQ